MLRGRAPAPHGRRRTQLALLTGGATLGGGLGLWLLVSWLYAQRLLHPARLAAGQLPSDLGYAYRDIAFTTADGFTLRGWWIEAPEPANATGSVIMLPGVGSTRAFTLARAGYLHEANYNLLLYDQRASGESGGTHITIGVKEADDARRAVDLAAAIAPCPIILFGYSMGGSVAITAAASDHRVAAVIDDSGFGSVEDLIEATGHRYTRPIPPAVLAIPIFAMVQRLGGFDLRSIRPIDAAARLDAPLLVITGELDEIVPAAQQQALAQRARGPARHVVFPGAGHEQAYVMNREEYEDLVLGFLASHLRAGIAESAGG
jgi:pimeloyl-ACP methyl ester carboxylesterase